MNLYLCDRVLTSMTDTIFQAGQREESSGSEDMQDGTREDEAGDQHCPHIERQAVCVLRYTPIDVCRRGCRG